MSVNIVEVAKYQKLLLWLILLQILILIGLIASGVLSNPAPPAGGQATATAGVAVLTLLLSGVNFVLSIAAVVVIVLLTGAMGWGVGLRVLVALLMFCPVISLITLLIVNARATGMLRGAGYSVGLMGARGGPSA